MIKKDNQGFNRKDDVGRLKEFMPEYLEKTQRSLIDFFKCANKQHTDDHPSMMYNKKNFTVHCFACGVTYDLFALIGEDNGYSGNKNFPKQLEKAREMFGDVKEVKASKEKIIYEKKDYKEFFKESLKNNQKSVDYLVNRGLSKDLIKKLCIGYDKEKDALIIPRDSNSYIERSLATQCAKKNRYKKYGKSGLYVTKYSLLHKDEPIFIVEGEIDAMSLMELGCNVIALGSVSNYLKIPKFYKDNNLNNELILALDADDMGFQTQKLLNDLLLKEGVACTSFLLYPEEDSKDASDMLVKHRDELVELVKKAKKKRNVRFYGKIDVIPKTIYVTFDEEVAKKSSEKHPDKTYMAILTKDKASIKKETDRLQKLGVEKFVSYEKHKKEKR